MDDFSETAEKNLKCELEKKHVLVAKVQEGDILKPSSKCFLVYTQIQQ